MSIRELHFSPHSAESIGEGRTLLGSFVGLMVVYGPATTLSTRVYMQFSKKMTLDILDGSVSRTSPELARSI